jgi:hypothetical protein
MILFHVRHAITLFFLNYLVHPSEVGNSKYGTTNTSTTGSTTSSSVGATARFGLWTVEQYLSICPYLSPTLSIFSLLTLEDFFPLLLSIFSSFPGSSSSSHPFQLSEDLFFGHPILLILSR